MKIKTICNESPAAFDRAVNDWLSDGWVLKHYEVRSSSRGGSMFHALLVLPDPPAEVAAPALEPMDPFDALRSLKDICEGVSGDDCETDKCPLWSWCKQLPGNTSPHRWGLPEKGGALV